MKKKTKKDPIKESLKRGLEQSAKGETHDLGSFAKYADEEPENKKRTLCVPEFFQNFDQLLQLLSKSDQRYLDKCFELLDQMDEFCIIDPLLRPQSSNVEFYRSSIKRIFSKSDSSNDKTSFIDSLKNERDFLYKFFNSNFQLDSPLIGSSLPEKKAKN